MNTAISILDYLHFDCPTAEQKAALIAMSTFIKEENTDDFLVLCGAAGTGKTSIVSALIQYMNETEVLYKISAPTGRAARIIGRKSGVLTTTIHSMIYKVEISKKTGNPYFRLRQNDEADRCVYIIDEASMISILPGDGELSLLRSDNSLLNDLVSFVKNGHAGNKVIFLGDRYQLAPMHEEESMALSPEYLQQAYGWKGAACMLTEVKRQEDGSSILKNAVRIREAIDNREERVSLSGFRFTGLSGAVTKYAEDLGREGHEYCVSIGATHNMNKLFNSLVRQRLYGPFPEVIAPGDLMIVTQNWWRNSISLYNGDHVIVESVDLNQVEEVAGLHFVPVQVKARDIDGTELLIDDYLLLESLQYSNGQLDVTKEGKLREARYAKNPVFRQSGFPADDKYIGALRMGYGHSITCNKAQGGEWEKVYMNTFYMPTLKYQYTAVTRAKSQLSFY